MCFVTFFFFLSCFSECDLKLDAKIKMMRKTYHLCLSAGNHGLLCRREEDYVRMVNCICIAALRTETIVLAFAVMANHIHLCVRSYDQEKYMKTLRYMYTRYFNSKYHRRGRLGERSYFVLELEGLHHILTAIAYVLRNPLHHGISATPFGYAYTSANAIFRKALGKTLPLALERKNMYRYLPEPCGEIPSGYRMDVKGMLFPDDIIDVSEVEHLFATPRSFLYYMNRLSGKQWEEEQRKDSSETIPVTLDDIEKGVNVQTIQEMLVAEHGKADYNAVSDITTCQMIDDYISEHCPGCRSVYDLPTESVQSIMRHLHIKYSLPKSQLLRCFPGLSRKNSAFFS